MAEEIKADFYEISPAEPYTKEDLNWMKKTSRSSSFGGTLEALENSVKESAHLTEGKVFSGLMIPQRIRKWAGEQLKK